MDIERTTQFLLDRQTQTEAEMQQLRSITANLATLVTEIARKQDNLAGIVLEIAEIQRHAEEERLRAEGQRLRAEEENRAAHQRYEEAHRHTEERLNILIRMMDEWIREQRERNKPE